VLVESLRDGGLMAVIDEMKGKGEKRGKGKVKRENGKGKREKGRGKMNNGKGKREKGKAKRENGKGKGKKGKLKRVGEKGPCLTHVTPSDEDNG
jgi:hypothetical protein